MTAHRCAAHSAQRPGCRYGMGGGYNDILRRGAEDIKLPKRRGVILLPLCLTNQQPWEYSGSLILLDYTFRLRYFAVGRSSVCSPQPATLTRAFVMDSCDLLQQLYDVDRSSPGFKDQLNSILYGKEYNERVQNGDLQDCSVLLVDYLNMVCLYASPLPLLAQTTVGS